jgi:dipeptidyl aminopeptidase/acylaminoacyl peptidase
MYPYLSRAAIRVAFFPLLLVALAGSAGAPLAAQEQKDGLPPLLDRQLFFGNPEISSATLSPDGQYIAFRKPWNGTLNLWVKKTADSYDQARRITAETARPIPGFFWSRDSRFVLFVQDQGGDENFNVYAVNPAEPPAAGSETPRARNITEAKGARAIIADVPRHDPDIIFVGLNDREAAWHDLYEIRISTGERKLLKQNTERIAGWMFDRSGALRLAIRMTDAGDTEILRVTDKGFERIYGCTVFETCGPLQFHPDNRRVYLVTNHGAPDLVQLVLLDPQTGREEVVESDPEKQVDFAGAIFSERTGELVATSYIGDRMRLYFRDKGYEADYQLIRKQLPGREISLAGSTADERIWMVVASSDTEPGERHIFNRDTKALTKQYAVFEDLPRQHLATMTPIRYTSSDGLEIPAYLTLPRGLPAKNLPLLVVPHGGPWARDMFGYNAMVQFFANRGYAVLTPNFRGSTGFGKTFLNAGNNEWGQKMQDDLTWGVRHLVEQGTADPKRVGILGASYGGYAALAGAAFTPDVYAAAVSIVGPSNLLTLLESIPPYWEAGRKMFHVRMGDPNTPEGKQQLERQSPLFSAERIRTPLLVIQGANDPRVKKAESDQIVIALRDRGFPVEYLVAPDEGHGFSRPVNNMAMYATIEAFLAKHLGGRFQDSMPPDVKTRLGEIRVDPKTVTLADKVDAKAVRLPDVAHPVGLEESHYLTTIALGANTIKMESINVAAEEGDRIVVTETAKTPQGDVTDRATLDRATLAVRGREVQQGPIAIRVTFDGVRAGGTVAMGGPEQKIDVELGGELFADGAGSYRSIAALPLKDGYSVTFRNFDVQRMRPTVKRLTVAAVENVTVPAGTFKAWRVQLRSAEGEPGDQTVWIDTATRRVLKISATMPQMGGAVATVELVK